MSSEKDKRKIAALFEKLRNRSRSKSSKCYAPNCRNNAIRSHIQQKEGSIREIAQDGHVVHLTTKTYLEGYGYKFEEVGIGTKSDTLTFWGFCNRCDTDIFKPIEVKKINYQKYSIQLLFAYRGLHTELYKIDYNILYYALIFPEKNIPAQRKIEFKNLDREFKLTKKIFNWTKENIDSEVFKSKWHFFKKRKFIFHTRKLRRLEICSTAIFSFPSKIRCELIDDELVPVAGNISSTIFFNLIPTEYETVFIFGIERSKKDPEAISLFNKVTASSQADLELLITNILIMYVETWFISIKLFEKWKSNGADKAILNYATEYSRGNPMKKHLNLPFNIFD